MLFLLNGNLSQLPGGVFFIGYVFIGLGLCALLGDWLAELDRRRDRDHARARLRGLVGISIERPDLDLSRPIWECVERLQWLRAQRLAIGWRRAYNRD